MLIQSQVYIAGHRRGLSLCSTLVSDAWVSVVGLSKCSLWREGFEFDRMCGCLASPLALVAHLVLRSTFAVTKAKCKDQGTQPMSTFSSVSLLRLPL